MFGVFLLLVGLLDTEATNSTCTSGGTCNACVVTSDKSSDGELVACVWCAPEQICVPSSDADSYCSQLEQVNSCDASYYTIIFIITCALLCLCMAACYMKKLHRRSGRRRTLHLLPAAAEISLSEFTTLRREI